MIMFKIFQPMIENLWQLKHTTTIIKSEEIRYEFRERTDRKCVRTWENAGERESAQAGDNLVNVRVKGWRLAGVNNEVRVVLDRLLETEGGRLYGVVRQQTEGVAGEGSGICLLSYQFYHIVSWLYTRIATMAINC